jgi:hypothetical protein
VIVDDFHEIFTLYSEGEIIIWQLEELREAQKFAAFFP